MAAVKNGVTPVWASEIEKFPIEVTKKHFPAMKHLGDICNVKGNKIEPVDIVCMGSPCQNLSIAGNRKGLAGEQSCLFTEGTRIIKEMRDATNGKYPRWVVWENVPGAFSSNKGNDFRTVLEEITETEIPMPKSGRWAHAGMVRGNECEVAWRVLDAQYWGVPQRRKRIFLVADFTGQCAGEILFKPESVSRDSSSGSCEGQVTARSIAGSLGAASTDTLAFNTSQITSPKNGNNPQWNDPCHCLAATDQPPAVILKSSIIDESTSRSTQDSIGAASADLMLFENHSQDTRYVGPLEVSPIVSATFGMGGNNQPFVVHKESAYCIAGNTIGRKVENGGNGKGINKEVSFTLNTIDRHAVGYTMQGFGLYKDCDVASSLKQRDYKDATDLAVQSDYRVRRLTPTECERLQGLNDGYTEGGSDSARYKALGNGMAQPCADFVISGITMSSATLKQ